MKQPRGCACSRTGELGKGVIKSECQGDVCVGGGIKGTISNAFYPALDGLGRGDKNR